MKLPYCSYNVAICMSIYIWQLHFHNMDIYTVGNVQSSMAQLALIQNGIYRYSIGILSACCISVYNIAFVNSEL